MKANRLFLLFLCAAIVCLCACGAASTTPSTPQPTAPPTPTPTSTPTPDPMWAEYADDALLSNGGYLEYIAEDSEYTVMLAFHPMQALTDISFHSLYFDGEQLAVETELQHLDAMTPDTPFVLGVVFYGDMTAYGVSFTAESGEPYHYAVSISGMDGSLVFTPVD